MANKKKVRKEEEQDQLELAAAVDEIPNHEHRQHKEEEDEDQDNNNINNKTNDDEVQTYNAMIKHVMQSTCAMYNQQVDRNEHLVFGSKTVQDTSVYMKTIHRWSLTYKIAARGDKRRIVRQVVRELVEQGCRFYQTPTDKKYCNILLPVQDPKKLENRIIRDINNLCRAEDVGPQGEVASSDDENAKASTNASITTQERMTLQNLLSAAGASATGAASPAPAPKQTVAAVSAASTNNSIAPPVQHVDVPKLKLSSSAAGSTTDIRDDVSSIHEVSIETAAATAAAAAANRNSPESMGVEQQPCDAEPGGDNDGDIGQQNMMDHEQETTGDNAGAEDAGKDPQEEEEPNATEHEEDLFDPNVPLQLTRNLESWSRSQFASDEEEHGGVGDEAAGEGDPQAKQEHDVMGHDQVLQEALVNAATGNAPGASKLASGKQQTSAAMKENAVNQGDNNSNLLLQQMLMLQHQQQPALKQQPAPVQRRSGTASSMGAFPLLPRPPAQGQDNADWAMQQQSHAAAVSGSPSPRRRSSSNKSIAAAVQQLPQIALPPMPPLLVAAKTKSNNNNNNIGSNNTKTSRNKRAVSETTLDPTQLLMSESIGTVPPAAMAAAMPPPPRGPPPAKRTRRTSGTANKNNGKKAQGNKKSTAKKASAPSAPSAKPPALGTRGRMAAAATVESSPRRSSGRSTGTAAAESSPRRGSGRSAGNKGSKGSATPSAAPSTFFGLAALQSAKSLDPKDEQFNKIVGEMMSRLQAVEQRMKVMESQNRRLKQRLVDLEEEEDRRGDVTVQEATAVAASYHRGGNNSNNNVHNNEDEDVMDEEEDVGESTTSLGRDMMMW